MTNFNWVDNPTENGVAICDPDILNECLMHLKYDNQKITKMYGCFNSGNINSNGNSDLIETQESSKVILNVPGTYNLNIPVSGYYQIVLVGGGGNGQGPSINYAGMYSYCGGGSGAAFVGEVYLNSGSHSIKVGGAGGNSSVDSLIVAGGSTNAGMSNYNMQRAGGYGGTLTISSSSQVRNVTVQKNGNNGGFSNSGTGQAGGSSVLQGYGKGADSSNHGRTNGYFSIIIPSYTNNVVYKVGGNYKPLAGTLADGTQFVLNGVNSDNVTNLSDGNYFKYIGSDGSSELLKTSLSVSKTQPATPNNNDVWINNAVSPLTVKKYVQPNYNTSTPAPVISSDGIMTGADGRFISYSGVDFTSAQSFKICGSFKCNGTTGFNQYFTGGDGFTYGLYVSGTQVFVNLSTNGTSFNIWQSGGTFNISYGQKYWYELEFTGTQYKVNYSTDGLNYTTAQTSNSSDINPLLIASFIHYIGNSSTAVRYFNGEIDLKDFKVYVDDVLVYTPDVLTNGWQPYDKIPLGKITVESGAVTGVETFPYNIDYIGNNIVKSYKNGNTGYQIYADGYCVQWGRADGANGGTVTLPVEYADSSYNIQLTSHRADSSYDTTAYVTGRLKGSFNWSSTTGYTAGMNWIVFGYKK